MKTKSIIILLLTFCYYGYSQVDLVPKHSDYWKLEGIPYIICKDTVTKTYVIKIDENDFKVVNKQHVIKNTLNDSSLFYDIHTEFGAFYKGKKFGKWKKSLGRVYEDEPIIFEENEDEIFIDDILIPATQNFSDSITIDYDNKIITCYFDLAHFRIDISYLPLRAIYWLDKNNGIAMSRCVTYDGKQIFEEKAFWVENAYRELVGGSYDYRINVP